MLNNLNPSFILDLTATPKQNANIVSLVSAIELKKENMVKLPVIVYNHQNIEGVIESALHLQNKLETEAKILEEIGVKQYKVGSGEVNNFLLLEKIALILTVTVTVTITITLTLTHTQTLTLILTS